MAGMEEQIRYIFFSTANWYKTIPIFQTPMPVASLRATEKIHRDIEEFLRPHGLYYDRRKNFYKNEGKPIEKIVSIPHLAQAIMATALQRPNDARARPSSLLKRDTDYETVFNDQYPIQLYLVCSTLAKLIDKEIKNEKFKLDQKDQNNVRFYAAMYSASLATQMAAPSPAQVASISIGCLTETLLGEAIEGASYAYRKLGASDTVAKGTDLVAKIRATLTTRFAPPKFALDA